MISFSTTLWEESHRAHDNKLLYGRRVGGSMTILREDLDETHQYVLYLRNTSQMLPITGISHFIIGTCIKLFMLTQLLLQLCQGANTVVTPEDGRQIFWLAAYWILHSLLKLCTMT